MVSRGSVRLLLAPIGALACLLAFSVASVTAEEPAACAVHVDPLAASGGSVFVFSGSGYKPTKLSLQKEGDDPIQNDINVGDADPWQVTVRSRPGDEGTWTATFNDAAANCAASVDFRVTLTSTDASSDLTPSTSTDSPPVLVYLLVVVVGFSGGLVIGRRMQATRRA